MIIYRALNEINGKSYIGQTIKTFNVRKSGHFYDAFTKKTETIFSRALRKYGKENFEWTVICECNSTDELSEMEPYYIKKYNTFIDDGNGYNMTRGGENYIVSDRTRKKGSKNNARYWKGKHLSEETKQKISESLTGNKLLEETKQKISKAHKGKIVLESTKEKLRNINLGKKASDITKKRMSESRMGREISKETREKLRKTLMGRKQHIIECPYCNKIGGEGLMKRWHFDNCEKIISQRKVICSHCNKVGGVSNMTRYHFDNCRNIHE